MKSLTECTSFVELDAECSARCNRRREGSWQEDARWALTEEEEAEFVAAWCAICAEEFEQRERIPDNALVGNAAGRPFEIVRPLTVGDWNIEALPGFLVKLTDQAGGLFAALPEEVFTIEATRKSV